MPSLRSIPSYRLKQLAHAACAWIWLTADGGWGASAQAATDPVEEYVVRNWTTADGIPHNTVRTIIETRDGYLWMGTANGLARFDGVRFVVFQIANEPALISDDIFAMYEDRAGSLWMRTRRGLARRSEGKFSFLSLTNGGPPVHLDNFVEDREGVLWMRGQAGLFRWQHERLERVPLPGNGPKQVVQQCAAAEGGLWLSASDGIWRFQNGQTEHVLATPSPKLLALGKEGELWGLVGTRELGRLRQGRWEPVSHLGEEQCSSLYVTPDGDVWVGSDSRNRAFRWHEGHLSEVDGQHGIEGNRVLAFCQDHDGNIWLGLNAGGLFRLREHRVRVLDRRYGLRSLNASSIGQLPDGTLLLSVMGSTLYRWADDRFEPIQVDDGAPSFKTPTALLPARAGGYWAGTFYGELARVENAQIVERIGSKDGTRSLFADRSGRLWRGTRTTGIECWSGPSLTRYSTNHGLSFNNVYCFAQDRDGAVWAGTEQGLNRIADEKITRFGPADGLGHQFVSSLCLDSRGTLWAGTLGGGLSAWTGQKFVTLTTREGLVHNSVDQIIEDDHEQLWLGTRAGLMRLPLSQLHDYLAGRSRSVTGKLIGRDEGLVRANFWTEYQPACLKTGDGLLWFCTGGGVVVVDPKRFQRAAATPRVHIEEVVVDGREANARVQADGTVTIPPGSERLEIRYTGISPAEPAQVRFRYRLAGYDRDWVEAGPTRFAAYSHLPPRPYQFQVKAVNSDGVWNDNGPVLALVVQPSFWQTNWFRAVLLLAMVALLLSLYRARIRRLDRRRAAQEEFSRKLIDSQEQERKRIAAELHDSLGQNLLVIKNRAALALTQLNQPDKLAAQVGEVSTMASAAIREVRDIAQNLRPFQIDELGLTQAITAMSRKLGESAGVEFKLDLDHIDGALPPEFEISLYRILQECLNNVAKHAQAKTASVRLMREAQSVRLIVQDEGRGFARERNPDWPASGFGLKSISERTRAMGGYSVVESRLDQGTRIEIVLPLLVRPDR